MKNWISAARLRTLPLTVSSIVMGAFLAQGINMFRLKIFGWAILTTVLLQILSNFANDYGDTQNGADTNDRVGPKRAVQSGDISSSQMLWGIRIMGVAALTSGVFLLYEAFGGFYSTYFWIFLGIGLVSILAGYTYTAGKKPYGYAGLGDLAVFLFFGIVGVVGSYFLYSLYFEWSVLLPAISCGALATAVLNINNIRDIDTDLKSGKVTIPVRLGRKNAIFYHWVLLLIPIVATLIYFNIKNGSWYYLISFPLILLNGFMVSKSNNPDPYLKTLALTSVAFVICFGLSIVLQ